MINTKEIVKRIEQTKARSAWAKAVKDDAIEMLTDLERTDFKDSQHLLKALLNGAGQQYYNKNDPIQYNYIYNCWEDFSYSGCALIYNGDIAEHYCTKSELERTRGGLLEPNKNEDWCKVQARGLYQSWLLIESNMGVENEKRN